MATSTPSDPSIPEGTGSSDEIQDAPSRDAGGAMGGKRRKQKILADALSGAPLKRKEAVNLESLRPSLLDFIRHEQPELAGEGYLSQKALDDYRGRYIAQLLREERGALSTLESEVVESLQTHDTLAENIEDDYEDIRSVGDRLADAVATFGGSWTFITSFCLILFVWMGVNLTLGEGRAFDAYPFILLNLVLSTVAALQAPIIMMSQRRQEHKDRLHALNDYKVNLKAELEIRHLHEKVDHLLNRQWERLMEIQQIQIEVMRDQANKTERALKAIKRPKPVAKARTKSDAGQVVRPAEIKEPA